MAQRANCRFISLICSAGPRNSSGERERKRSNSKELERKRLRYAIAATRAAKFKPKNEKSHPRESSRGGKFCRANKSSSYSRQSRKFPSRNFRHDDAARTTCGSGPHRTLDGGAEESEIPGKLRFLRIACRGRFDAEPSRILCSRFRPRSPASTPLPRNLRDDRFASLNMLALFSRASPKSS